MEKINNIKVYICMWFLQPIFRRINPATGIFIIKVLIDLNNRSMYRKIRQLRQDIFVVKSLFFPSLKLRFLFQLRR
jgi:hypothetical protein